MKLIAKAPYEDYWQSDVAPIEGAHELWADDVYQVEVTRADKVAVLSVSRIDGQRGHSWVDLQRIKNAIAGPECEAVELFPAQSRMIDVANKYHLWVVLDHRFRFPIGWKFFDDTPDKPPNYDANSIGGK